MRALAAVLALALAACASSQASPPPPAAVEVVKGADAPHPCPCRAWVRDVPSDPGCVELQASPPWNGCGVFAWGYIPTAEGAVLGFRALNEDRSHVKACGPAGLYRVHAVSESCGCAIATITVPRR